MSPIPDPAAEDDASEEAAAAAELERRAGDLTRLESLTQDWDEAHLRILTAIKSGIEDLNAEAFRRLIRRLRRDAGAAAALREAVRDPLLYHVLRFHGLVREPLEQRLERALEEVRPFLADHGGDVELVAIKRPDTIEVRLVGSCHGCPSSGETLSEGVAAAVRRHCPEIRNVVRVSRSAAAQGGETQAQVVRFVSPFARSDDAGWTDVCALAELPDGALVSRVCAGRDLLFYREADRVSSFENACAHMGMALDGGEVRDGLLTCPYHGFRCRLDTGECVTIPEVQLAAHAVRLIGDRVAVKLSP